MQWRIHEWHTKELALLALIVGALFGQQLGWQIKAHAHPASSCSTVHYYLDGTQGTQQGNHQGVKGDVWFASASDDQCYRVVSLIVHHNGGQVECGWVKGWFQGTNCDQQYHQQATTYEFWFTSTGPYHCRTLLTSNGGLFNNMATRDTNQNEIWGAYENGADQGANITVDFSSGNLQINAERFNSSDDGFAHFKSLQFQVSGNSTWFDFSALQQDGDGDPDYNFYKCSSGAAKFAKTNVC